MSINYDNYMLIYVNMYVPSHLKKRKLKRKETDLDNAKKYR